MADDESTVHLMLKQVNGDSHRIEINLDEATVKDLKLKVQEKLNYPPEAQRLIFQGRVLDENNTLKSYSLTSGLTVHLAVNTKLVPPSSSPTPVSSAPTPSRPSLAQILPLLRVNPSGPGAIATLTKMAENILKNPTEEKYRKIRLSNEALKRKVLDVPHGLASVEAMGFAHGVEEGHLVLVPNASNWEHLQASKRILDQFNTVASTTASYPSTPFAAPTAAPAAPFGGMGGMNPGMLANMLQNPAFAQMLTSDPRIQQMAQGNPMLQQALQNPAMLQQSLQALQNDPYMRQQMEQMMANPQQMQNMMQNPMFGNPHGGFGMPPPPPSTPSPFASQVSLNNPTSTSYVPSPPPVPSIPAAPSVPRVVPNPTMPVQQLSEEDEIAEAIARSLREM